MDSLANLNPNHYGDECSIVRWVDIQKNWRHELPPDENLDYWDRGEEIFAWNDYVIRAIGVTEGMERSYIVRR